MKNMKFKNSIGSIGSSLKQKVLFIYLLDTILGDCKRDGTVSGHYLDKWGADNLGSDKNEGVCFGRAKAIWEYCTNSQQQPVRATFLGTGKSATYPEGGKENFPE